MKIPESLRKRAEDDPSVTIMEYTYDKEVPQLNASTVAAFIRIIQTEFCSLLHHTNSDDAALKTRMRSHVPFNNFAARYPTIFSKITTREFALSPPMMSLVLYEVYVLERVQSGELDNDQACALISQASFDMITKELSRKGVPTPKPNDKGQNDTNTIETRIESPANTGDDCQSPPERPR